MSILIVADMNILVGMEIAFHLTKNVMVMMTVVMIQMNMIVQVDQLDSLKVFTLLSELSITLWTESYALELIY